MSSISLKPELSELYPLNEYITNILKKEDLKVNLIVEEVFVNIVNYSNAKHVTVAASFENQILTVEFIDDGIEFNPLIIESPKIPNSIEDAQIGGLGIFLTKEMADNLDYEYLNGENHLKIMKKVE